MLVIVQTRAVFGRGKYKPVKALDCWAVIDALSGDEMVFDAERGDDAEVVTRSPQVFGPTTFYMCQAWISGTQEYREFLQNRLRCIRRHGVPPNLAVKFGDRPPLIITVTRPVIRGVKADRMIIDGYE